MEKVRPSRPCENLEKSILGGVQKNKIFNLPLSESEIIEFHNILMTPTQHMIQTTTVTSGRALIKTMLQSLAYYRQIGCLSSASTTLWHEKNDVIDIYSIIRQDAQVYGLWYAIERFFINYNNIDFIWVELTDDLVAQMGSKYVMQMCQLLTEHQTIPVVVLQYENGQR